MAETPSRPRPDSPAHSPIPITDKHPLWLRWTHWVNFPLILLMIWSGVLIYWANPAYPGFFPKWFYSLFKIDHRLAEGMSVHFTLAWLLGINGVAYCTFLLASGHWRELFPERSTFPKLLPTVLHDLGFKEEAPPQGKFNAAQRLVYTMALGLAVLEFLTGLAIYKPVQLQSLTWIFGGYEGARLLHFIGMLALSGFFFVHVIQVIRAGWNQFRAMVTGFEVKEND